MRFQCSESERLKRAKMNARLNLIAILAWAAGSLAAEPWTLQRALERAAANNPDARIAQQRMSAADANLRQANSAFWPKAQVQSSYTRTDVPMLAFGNILNQRAFDPSLNFNNVAETDDVNVRGLVTAPLYAGGRNKAGRNAAREARQASKFDKAAVLNQLEFEVVRAFLAIRKSRQRTLTVEATVRSFETNLLVAAKRHETGSLLKADVLDLEVRLAEAKEQRIHARNAGRLAEHALKNLLGIENDEPFVIDDEIPKLAFPGEKSSERPETLSMRHKEDAARWGVRAAKSGHLPRVSAFGSVDYNYGTITRGDGTSYAAGVVAQWDLWDGFSTRSKIREAEAIFESVQEEARKVRLAVGLEIEQARLNLLSARERLAAAGKAVEQGGESVKLTHERFQQGLALSTQLIDAETALLAARVRREEAESDEQLAIASLRKALALPQLEEIPNSK